MKLKIVLLVLGPTLVGACALGAFLLVRSSSSPVVEKPPAPPPATEEVIDVEPSLSVGARVEALSAEGWQVATIKEVGGGQALIDYDRGSLDDERIDVRLLRKPGDELVSKPTAPSGRVARATPASDPARTLRPWEDPSVPHEMGTPKNLRPEEQQAAGPRLVGCFKDSQPFDLDGHLEAGNSNTPQACTSKCASLGFRYAGVQDRQSCLCGNSYGRYGPADNCNLPCTGDGAQICGGSSANSVYETGVVSKPAPPSVTTSTPATPPAPPLGPRAGGGGVAVGAYACRFDAGTSSLKGAPAGGAQITLTIEIVSDRIYRAFNGGDDKYSYDPASGRITWKTGMLGDEEPGQYRADSRSIATSVGGQAMTCTLGR